MAGRPPWSMAGATILPLHINDAARDGKRDQVIQWLNAGGDINARANTDEGTIGSTLLFCTVACRDLPLCDKIALAQELIARGADVNIQIHWIYGGYALLHNVLKRYGQQWDDPPDHTSLDLLALLLKAPGVDVNVRNYEGSTAAHDAGISPLCVAIGANDYQLWRSPDEVSVASVRMLLRAGASLDGCRRQGGGAPEETAEDIMQNTESDSPHLARNHHWCAIKRLVAGVRRYGTYKKYIRQPHRDVLTIHGLVQRGNLSTEEPVMKFLARFGNKFVVWRILQYWRDSGAD